MNWCLFNPSLCVATLAKNSHWLPRRNWRLGKPKTINSFGNQPILVEKTLMSISRKLPFSSTAGLLGENCQIIADNWQLLQKNWEEFPSSQAIRHLDQDETFLKQKNQIALLTPFVFVWAQSTSYLPGCRLHKKKLSCATLNCHFLPYSRLVSTLSPCWIIVRLFNKCDTVCLFCL